MRAVHSLLLLPALPEPAAANERAFNAFIKNKARSKRRYWKQTFKGVDNDPDLKAQRLCAPARICQTHMGLSHPYGDGRQIAPRAQKGVPQAFLDGLEEKWRRAARHSYRHFGGETNYGGNKGSFSALRSLATLGYEGKRVDFGRQQLLYALRILQSGDVALADFKAVGLVRWGIRNLSRPLMPIMRPTYRAMALKIFGPSYAMRWLPAPII